jgi:ketosteroid isomerase-like protein
MTQVNNGITESIQDLIALNKKGEFVKVLEKHYADDFVRQANNHSPIIGKEENIRRETIFLANIDAWNEVIADALVIEGNRAAIHWVIDVTEKSGRRLRIDEIAWQVWENGKVKSERFFYDTAAVIQNPA